MTCRPDGGARRRRPWWAALLVLLGLTASIVLATAGPASAHASLVSTDPSEGTVLEVAPERIRFTFSGRVAHVPDGVRVLDAAGAPVASSSTVQETHLDVVPTGEVGDGTYVVLWRVLSQDGHPLTGTLTFSVGEPSLEVAPLPEGALVAPDPPRSLSAARWVGYVGLLLTVGLVGFTLLLLPRGGVADRSRGWLVRVARVAAPVTVVAWLVGLPLGVLHQFGGGAGSLTSASTWDAVPWADYVALAGVVLGVAVAVVLLGHGLPTRLRRGGALVAAALAASAPALTGHTRGASPEVLVVGADALHLLAGSVWLGGLVALAIALPDLGGRETAAAELLSSFSGIAAGVLAALIATGSLLAWRVLGSWSGLVDTGYGQLLLVKIAVALVAVAIAAWNRFGLLPRLHSALRRKERRAGAGLVARATAAEAGVLVVALLVTGFLVDRTAAADASVARTGPVVETAMAGEVQVRVELMPGRVGSNVVRLRLTDAAGAPTEALAPPRAVLLPVGTDAGAVQLEHHEDEVAGSRDVPLTQVVTGAYTGQVELATAGTWSLQVALRTTAMTQPVATLEFEVTG